MFPERHTCIREAFSSPSSLRRSPPADTATFEIFFNIRQLDSRGMIGALASKQIGTSPRFQPDRFSKSTYSRSIKNLLIADQHGQASPLRSEQCKRPLRSRKSICHLQECSISSETTWCVSIQSQGNASVTQSCRKSGRLRRGNSLYWYSVRCNSHDSQP